MTARRGRRAAALLLLLALVPPAAAESLTVQLSDVRQAQFAGYYVARAKGYYAAAGLTVTLLAGAADGEDRPIVADPRVDVWSAWMPTALAAREHGLPLVNIAQMFPHSGLEIICRKGAIHAPTDLRGKTIAVWPGSARIPFDAWMRKLALGAPGDVTPLPVARGDAAAALLDHRASCVTALNYDTYWRLIAAGASASDLQIFHYGDAGVATLQDGLYTRQASLTDPSALDRLSRFLRASIKGWSYAISHQAEAAAIVLADAPQADAAEVLRQSRMLSSVARLTESGLQRMGWLEPASYDRTVQLLLQAGALAAPPSLAWTHEVWSKVGERKPKRDTYGTGRAPPQPLLRQRARSASNRLGPFASNTCIAVSTCRAAGRTVTMAASAAMAARGAALGSSGSTASRRRPSSVSSTGLVCARNSPL